MKIFTLLIGAWLTTLSLFGQSISNCNLDGDNSRWESRWKQPGTTASIHAMIEGPDGNVWATGSYGGSWGGDPQIDGLVSWDGKRWTQIGGNFQCTSCGLGTRYALVMDQEDNVYIGGFFESAMNLDESIIEGSGLIRWNDIDEVFERLGDLLNDNNSRGTAYALEVDTIDGILYVGGDFSKVVSINGDTTLVSNIAALDLNNMTWSNVGGGVQNTTSYIDGKVYALEMGPAQTLYVGGGFDAVGGQTVYSVAQWNMASGWSGIGLGLPSNNVLNGDWNFATAFSLHYDQGSGRLYAGGTFGEFAGSSSVEVDRSLAYFQDNNWTLIDGINSPFNSLSFRVNTLTTDPSDGRLFVGGTFTEHNGSNSPVVNLVGAWNPMTNQWDDLDDGLLSGRVDALVFKNDTLYTGGVFSRQTNGAYANNFAAWDGNNWDNLGEGMNENFTEVYDMILQADGFMVCGNFDEVDAIDAERVARWRETSGWEMLPFNVTATSASNFNKLIYTIHQEGDWIYFGGFFGGLGDGTTTNGIAAYNLTTGMYKSWGTGLDGSFFKVNQMTMFKGELYIAGRFDGINGVAAKNIAKLNIATDTWSMVGTASNEVINLENVKDSILLVGGSFTNIDGNADLARVAVYNGTTWSSLGQGIINGVVQDMAYVDGMDAVFVGGTFATARQSDGSTISTQQWGMFQNGTWTSFDDLTNQFFRQVGRLFFDEQTGLLYMTGQFKEVNGVAASRIVRIDPLTMNVGSLGAGMDYLNDQITGSSNIGGINFMARQNDYLVLGGKFNAVGLNQARAIARYDLEDYENDLAELDIALPENIESCEALTLTSFANSMSLTSINGCTNSDETMVTIFPTPMINFEGIANDTVFSCDSIVLTPSEAFVEYQWNLGTSFEPTYTATSSGWVIFEGQDMNGCFGKDSVYVIIPDYDLINDLPESQEACSMVTIDPGTDDFSYEWSNGEMSAMIEVMTSGTYTVTVTSIEGCTEVGTTQVTIYPMPAIVFEGVAEDSVMACDNFTLNPMGDFVEYSWNQGMGFDSTFEVTNSGWVYFEGQDENNCIGSDSVYVNIDSVPDVAFTYEIIEDSVLFFIINPVAGVSYDWDFGDGQSANGEEVTHVYDIAGDYMISVVASNNCGEEDATESIMIDVIDAQVEIYTPANFMAFPNPTTGKVWLQWEQNNQAAIQLEVFDVHGKRLFVLEREALSQQEVQLDLSAFPAGVYLGKLSSREGVFGFRINKAD